MLRRRCIAPRAAWSAALVLAAGESLLAQPTLLPPGPPFAPSGRMGTRTEITALPYAIVAPGSYYVSMTLFQPPIGGDGITVDSSNVTIDLMGHALIGAFLPGSAIVGGPGGPYENITVHNGFTTGWGGSGVDLDFSGGGFAISHVHVFDVTSSGNGGPGIAVGSDSIVRNVICGFNFGAGIQLGIGSKLTNGIAEDNGGNGVEAVFGTHVSDSVASSNGLNGFLMGVTCVVIGSVAFDNADDGFELILGCRATDCVAQGNGFVFGGSGFLCAGDGNSLGGCVADFNSDCGFNSFPFPPPGGSSVHDCVANMNGIGPPGPGPFAGGDGFANFRSVIQCMANGNTDNGIECAMGGHVSRNTCEGNTASGILATGDGNMIQHNNVSFNGTTGIDTTFNGGPGGNFITSNGGHFNPVADFAFSPFCSFGPIIFAVPGPLPLAAMVGNVSYP